MKTIKNIPTRKSKQNDWLDWFELLKKELPVFESKRLWAKAWNVRRGKASVSFAKKMESHGIIINNNVATVFVDNNKKQEISTLVVAVHLFTIAKLVCMNVMVEKGLMSKEDKKKENEKFSKLLNDVIDKNKRYIPIVKTVEENIIKTDEK